MMPALVTAMLLGSAALAADPAPRHALRGLERSYWVHASLADDTRRGYWGAAFPAAAPATDAEVARAARLLAGHYGANRLYLILNNEVPAPEAERLLLAWRRACPRAVDLVPTFVLRMYDRGETPVYADADLRRLLEFSRQRLRARRVAVYDVYPRRGQGSGLGEMAARFPDGVLRVGLQPGEPIGPPYAGAVEDTWSAFCHGKTEEDWRSPGFGRETLRGWVRERNSGAIRVAWDLIVVAWDYLPTQRGEYPGYDDAARNMPLPSGRNAAGATLVLGEAAPACLAGFSSDLFILQANSASGPHDGAGRAFYRALREGRQYDGYYAKPLEEVAAIYRALKAGRPPGSLGPVGGL